MTRRLMAALVAAVTAGALVATPASAVRGGEGTTGGGARHVVTLVTGDRVQATVDAAGRWEVGLEPSRDGSVLSAVTFARKRGVHTDVYLVPGGAVSLVRAGLVDQELFNISGLVRQGYDDARSRTTPLLIQHGGAGIAAAPQGATVTRTLPSVNMTAADESKERAGQFWASLTGGGAQLAGGATRVWLDARIQASLDRSVPQIGAPKAWEAGYTGKGVTVAVLDTGIDADHPDLKGKVATSKDFSGKGSVEDGNGHGTHVASTVAGSGAASGGKYKGAAPDAGLAVGKVLDDGGYGSFSDIIAGMEWAAGDVKAKVVSMSLGGGPSDGTDPASQAVNALSKQHGTLFVIAAGNFGSDETVSAPAAADSALAVGSVTKGGALSDFSSRGPRTGDGAAKPEIAAPGTDIIAAKAKGNTLDGEVVDEHYLKISGTSMATPHTAGAAAIVAQQHPDWSGETIKATLVGTAKPVDGTGVYATGGGLVDLARGTTQTVRAAQSSVSTYLKWPATEAQTRKVGYVNDGAAPVTLKLGLTLADAKGAKAPDKLAALSADTVTVPAKGTAEVSIAAHPRSGKPGVYGGVLTATAEGVSVRTPVSVQDEPEKYDVGATFKDRDGRDAASADVSLINTKTGAWYSAGPGVPARVEPGTYTAVATIVTTRPDGSESLSAIAQPALKVTKATTLSFDARKAKRAGVSTDQPAARDGVWTSRFETMIKDYGRPFGMLYMNSPRFSEFYVGSLTTAVTPGFDYADNFRLEEPGIELFGEGAERFEVVAGWLRDSPEPALAERLPTVFANQGRPEDLKGVDVKGKLVVLSVPGETTYDEAFKRIAAIKDLGGKMVALHVPPDTALAARSAPSDEAKPVLPSLRLFDASGARFVESAKKGGFEASIVTRKSSKYVYELAFPSAGKVPTNPVYKVKTADLAAVTMAYHGGTEDEPAVAGARFEAFGRTIATQWYLTAVANAERVEYYTPGTWEFGVSGWWAASGMAHERATLTKEQRQRKEWFRAVAAPTLSGTTSNELGTHPWIFRKGGLVDVTVPFFTDAAGHGREADPWFGYDKGRTTLHRDGELLATHEEPGRGVFVAEAGRKYTLTSNVVRDAPWWPTSTKVDVSWTWQETRYTEDGSLPLLSVAYRPEVGLDNTAKGGGQFTIPVTVTRADKGGTASSLEIEVSYDDGATWRKAAVDKDGEQWKATVTHPATGFASLRATAADGSGNSVSHTVIRAYRIG